MLSPAASEAPVRSAASAVSDYMLKKYLPHDWRQDDDDLPADGRLRMAFIADRHGAGPNGWAIAALKPSGSRYAQPIPMAMGDGKPDARTSRLVILSAQAGPLDAQGATAGRPVLIRWQPNPERLGLNGAELVRFLGERNLPYVRRNSRVAAKVDFYGRLDAIEFFTWSRPSCKPRVAAVRDGMDLFGGSATQLTSTDWSNDTK